MIKGVLYHFILTILILVGSQLNGQTHLKEITSKSDFELLESKPLSEKYSNTSAVKVILEISSGEIYFIESKKYKFHYDFCSLELGYPYGMADFNEYNYQENKNRYYRLATINHYKDAGIYTFEFSTSETLCAQNVDFYTKVKALFRLNTPLRLFPSANKQIEFMERFFPEEGIVRADEIYKNQKYQALNQTYSYGRLTFIDMDDFENSEIGNNDIIVVNGTPNEMPFCRGIITTDFQPPLSHIVLLSHNRGTPVMALRNAWENKKLRALENQYVRYNVGSKIFEITEATKDQAEKFWARKDKRKPIRLDMDLEVRGIQSVSNLNSKSVDFVGGKAANFGELNQIYLNNKEKLSLPKAAFAIPFCYYAEHITNNKVQNLIEEVLSSEIIQNDIKLLDEKLKTIRKAIKKGKINPWLLSDVEELVRENGIPRLRFRSSTNAEDIDGFNGAGLYDSKTGILDDEKKSIEKAIKKVWASLWNLRAFQERAFFKMDQSTVAMGILVHQSFPNEEVNGVAITKNIYRPERNGFVVNVQKGDIPIVLPPEGVTSEQFIIKHNLNLKNQIEVDYISYSSENDHIPMLTMDEMYRLSKILSSIKSHFYKRLNNFSAPSFQDFAMDVEFKLEEGSRNIIVKQARIYN